MLQRSSLIRRFCSKSMISKTTLIVFCLFISALSSIAQAPPVSPSESKMVSYNAQAVQLINNSKFDEAFPLIELALKERENGLSYYYLCHIYTAKHEYQKAIDAGEKSIKLDPNFIAVYNDLFYAYTQSGDWEKAQGIVEQAKKSDANGALASIIESVDEEIEKGNYSKGFSILLFLLLAGAFIYPIYIVSKKDSVYFTVPSAPRLSEAILVGSFVSALIWVLFYAFSEKIWNTNPKVSPADFTPFVRGYSFEHDGMESTVLYISMFVSMLGGLFVTPLLLRFRTSKSLYMAMSAVLIVAAGYFFFNIGFYPPQSAFTTKNIVLPVFIAGASVGLYWLYNKTKILALIPIFLFAAFAGLISLGETSRTDLMFILDPAYRLFHGFKVSEIYFQYDIYLSLLGLAWMKMNMDIGYFAYLAQLSFFLFFVGSFFFSDRFFKHKGLSVFFIITLILVRFYCVWADNPTIFQVTPIRVDLWIVLLLLVNWKGINHWVVGVCLGLLIIFHRNLGLIYSVAYIELLVVMFMLDVISLVKENKLNGKEVGALFIKHLRTDIINVGLILASVALCFILFHEFFSASALIYKEIGVGMLPVAKRSFYWYVPVLLGCLSVFLYYFREKVGPKYFATAIFIMLLAVGNSMYFFGRSHENNVLNITGLLVLVLFVLFDVLIFTAPAAPIVVVESSAKGKGKNVVAEKQPFVTMRKAVFSLPVLFILFVGFFYGDRIAEKTGIQMANFQEGNYASPFPPMSMDTAAVKEITHNSQNVYFLDFSTDFYYFYYGNYVPQGYFSPCASWVYKKDLVKLMQDLIDKHYYVVINLTYNRHAPEYIRALDYNQTYQKNDMISFSKQDVNNLLPVSKADVYHVAIKDQLASYGIDKEGIEPNENFTLEMIIKPSGMQAANSMLLANLTRFDVYKGVLLQSVGNANQYLFGVGTGGGNMPTSAFMLEENKWHYLAITVTKDLINIYDNGKLIANANPGGAKFVNSSMPMTIGNSPEHKSNFKGLIREVKIANGTISEAEILANAARVNEQLAGK